MNSKCIIINPALPATSSVIWLHGLGADGHDFADLVPQLQLPENARIRFLFPHAPFRTVTINGHMTMRAWYDIYRLDTSAREDAMGMAQSQSLINQFIEQEIKAGIPSRRIVLAGFSQGGALALYTGLRYPHPLAGLVALSAYLPLQKTIETEKHSANQTVPIFLAHGRFDPVLSITLGQQAYEKLKKWGHPVSWHEYAMQHHVCPQEINDIQRWLLHILGESSGATSGG